MSRSSLRAYLTHLHDDLVRNSAPYRTETADRRQIDFYFSASLFASELEKEFKFRNLEREFQFKRIQKYIKKGSEAILSACKAQATKFETKGRDITVYSDATSIVVILSQQVSTVQKKNVVPGEEKNFNNFSKLKELYTAELQKFVVELNRKLKLYSKGNAKLNKTSYYDSKGVKTSTLRETDTEVTFGGDLLEGGHTENSGVIETRVRDAIGDAIDKTYKKGTPSVVSHNLKAMGIDLGMVRDDKNDTHSFYMQSKVNNRELGDESGIKKQKFLDDLKAALLRLNDKTPIKGLKGSLSIEEVKVQEVEFTLISPFKGKKNIKVVTKAKKPTYKRKEELIKGRTTKATRAKSKAPKAVIPLIGMAKNRGKARSVKGLASSPLHLIGLINKELPQTVLKNMGAPGLVNRTGTFARSAEITDIVQTPQGFPSIGYTYDRQPYGVFEDGEGAAPWANGQRDPRKIIDRSIREIAAQFALGRFYTRRQ